MAYSETLSQKNKRGLKRWLSTCCSSRGPSLMSSLPTISSCMKCIMILSVKENLSLPHQPPTSRHLAGSLWS
ncbi:rCG34521 [Rattus norvegicus]|uniref:RCG34521 n=1 Tax=Rattus norvegicus TaxID=10116 RepID=A6HHT1_RAT|nr:rCG34521 [Rattus norvegicus]